MPRSTISLYLFLWLMASAVSFFGGIVWERTNCMSSAKSVEFISDSSFP